MFENIPARIKKLRRYNMDRFFQCALNQRSFLIKAKVDLHSLGTNWEIARLNGYETVGIQKKSHKAHGLVFPIYRRGSLVSKDFYIYKKDSISKNLCIFKMRTKKILVSRLHEDFRSFGIRNANQIIFLKTKYGILSLYLHESKMKYIYMNQTDQSSPKILNLEELDGMDRMNFKWIVLFKASTILLVSSYGIFITKLNFENKWPKLIFEKIIKPYDLVRSITCSNSFIILIGYKSIQLLQLTEENGVIKTAYIANHDRKFRDDCLDSLIKKKTIYVSDQFNIYSFDFRSNKDKYISSSIYI